MIRNTISYRTTQGTVSLDRCRRRFANIESLQTLVVGVRYRNGKLFFDAVDNQG
jgi:hypothetical protein